MTVPGLRTRHALDRLPYKLASASMRTAFLLTICLVAAGCGRGLSIDEAYGRPDATAWTYFYASPDAVVTSITRHYASRGVDVESTSRRDGGLVLTLARRGTANSDQILVQATDVQTFRSRAQIYPVGRPLSRDLEMSVSARL